MEESDSNQPIQDFVERVALLGVPFKTAFVDESEMTPQVFGTRWHRRCQDHPKKHLESSFNWQSSN
jgi:hypothetical protein